MYGFDCAFVASLSFFNIKVCPFLNIKIKINQCIISLFQPVVIQSLHNVQNFINHSAKFSVHHSLSYFVNDVCF